MSQSSDAHLCFGLYVCHEDNGDFPSKFEELEGEGPDLLDWLSGRVKEFGERRGLELEICMHCCNNCSGYIVHPKGYHFRAWRGEPIKLEDVLPEVHDDVKDRLLELAEELGVEDPESKTSWWLASYGDL